MGTSPIRVETVVSNESGVPRGDQIEQRCEFEAPLDPQIPKDEKQGTLVEDLVLVSIYATDPTKTVKIGSNFSGEQQRKVIILVK